MSTSQNFPPLPIHGTTHPSKKRICIIMHECLGPTQNNGLGTAYTLLGEALAAAGHRVTFLYATTTCARKTLDYWAEHYRQKQIEFILLPEAGSTEIDAPDWLRHPYRVYLWLKDREFDILHYPEYPGNGYFIALAKQLGLGFAKTILCLGTHGPSMWSRQANHFTINAVRHLAMDFMERQSASLSDVVISPSQYLLGWLQKAGWSLPPQVYVQQNIQSPDALVLGTQPRPNPEPLREIVYFGRIEPRKGYDIFCDAIELLPPDLQEFICVIFLGSSIRLYSGNTVDEVKHRAANWPCRTWILDQNSHQEALSYLHTHPCFAIIPSRDEVMGYVVMECIGAGIPFLAAHVGGIPELVADEDQAHALFTPADAKTLAQRMERALREGLATARPAIAFDVVRQGWMDWHDHVHAETMADASHPNHVMLPANDTIFTAAAMGNKIEVAKMARSADQDLDDAIAKNMLPQFLKALMPRDTAQPAEPKRTPIDETADRPLVIALVAQNENEALGDASTVLGRAFEKHFRHRIIDMRRPDGARDLMAALKHDRVALAYSFAGVGSQFTVDKNANLWTAARVPFAALWYDHPCYNYRQHIVDSPFVFHCYHVRDHFEARQKHLPKGLGTSILLPIPHQIQFPGQIYPLGSREHVLVYAKTAQAPEQWIADWKRHPEALQNVLHALAERAIRDRNLDLADAAQAQFKQHNLPTDNLDLFMGAVQEVDAYIRAWRSDKLARALLPHPVKIIGRGWEYLQDHPHQATFLQPISATEYSHIMWRARIVANTNPLWRDGIHERVWGGITTGALTLTDHSEKADALLGDLPNYLGFEWQDELPDVVADALRKSAEDNVDYFLPANRKLASAGLTSHEEYIEKIIEAAMMLRQALV